MKVKDLSKLILGRQELLVEVVNCENIKNGIIVPASVDKSNLFDHGVVIAVGEDIKDIKPTDIILETRMKNMEGSTFDDKLITMMSRSSITLATPASNFNNNVESKLSV